MADLSNNSFIPKRGPTRHKRADSSRQVYFFTLVSYILMFATLLAVGGVYFFGKYIDTQLETEISSLNSEIKSFSESEMQRVLDFDMRLSQASGRLNSSVSLVSIFESLEAATIDSVQILSLDLVREKDEMYNLEANVQTDSFDSTIFQRGVFKRNQTISSVDILNLNTETLSDSEAERGSSEVLTTSNPVPVVKFTAELEVALSDIPYLGNLNNENLNASLEETIITDDVEAEGIIQDGNQDNI